MTALRAFDAAAKLGSFTRAAAELHVTQSAVSQSIRHLESLLGVALFERSSGRLQLTSAGRRYAAAIRPSLETIVEATRAAAASRNQLTITCARSLLQKWLLARLHLFRSEHPDIELQLTGVGLGEPYDLGEINIVAAAQGTEPAGATLLARDRLVVVASSQFAAERGVDLVNLEQMPLIDGLSPTWDLWRSAAGLPTPSPASTNVLRLREATAIIQAAIDGHGAALVSEMLASDDLAAGRLIRLSDISIPRARAYWLMKRGQCQSDAAGYFARWIQSVVER